MVTIDIDIGKAAWWWSFQAPAHCIEVQLQCQRQLLSGLWGTWLEIWCRLLGTSCPIQIIVNDRLLHWHCQLWTMSMPRYNNGSMTSQWHCQWHCESNLKIQSDRFCETCQWHCRWHWFEVWHRRQGPLVCATSGMHAVITRLASLTVYFQTLIVISHSES